MSTLAYFVRDDWEQRTAQMRRDQRQVAALILAVAIATTVGVGLADRLAGSVAWRSFISEAFSSCLYAAAAVWYALRDHPRRAWCLALIVYIAGLTVMALTDLVTKRGVSGATFLESARSGELVTLAGVSMGLFIPIVGWVVRRYPDEMRRIGMGLARLRVRLAVGAVAGLLIGVHLLVAAYLAGMELSVKPGPFMVWQAFYELGPQSLPEEMFMRGVIFNELFFCRQWNFWPAAFSASAIGVFSILVKQEMTADLVLTVGAIFYLVVGSVVSAALFRWSCSLLPGYANSVVFDLVATLC